jgi:hypothetical protein
VTFTTSKEFPNKLRGKTATIEEETEFTATHKECRTPTISGIGGNCRRSPKDEERRLKTLSVYK